MQPLPVRMLFSCFYAQVSLLLYVSEYEYNVVILCVMPLLALFQHISTEKNSALLFPPESWNTRLRSTVGQYAKIDGLTVGQLGIQWDTSPQKRASPQ